MDNLPFVGWRKKSPPQRVAAENIFQFPFCWCFLLHLKIGSLLNGLFRIPSRIQWKSFDVKCHWNPFQKVTNTHTACDDHHTGVVVAARTIIIIEPNRFSKRILRRLSFNFDSCNDLFRVSMPGSICASDWKPRGLQMVKAGNAGFALFAPAICLSNCIIVSFLCMSTSPRRCIVSSVSHVTKTRSQAPHFARRLFARLIAAVKRGFTWLPCVHIQFSTHAARLRVKLTDSGFCSSNLNRYTIYE